MIASPIIAAVVTLAATAFFWVVGYAFARVALSRRLAFAAAPTLGWGVYSAATLPVFFIVPFSAFAVAALALAFFVGSIAWIVLSRDGDRETISESISIWPHVVAAALALVPAAAIAPKITSMGVQLADQIFDHSKIAMIDAIVRLGLPPVNPFFGENGEPGRLVYYYLYYFSAAQISILSRVSGWEADLAMTWFAAFSSLSLMMGLATWISGRSSAALLAVILNLGTALRDLLAMLVGAEKVGLVLAPATGFAGWMFQAAWVPQHLMSASCVVVAMLLLSINTQRQTPLMIIILALAIVAGFECSTYVGGVTFAIAALIAVPVLYARTDPARRTHFVFGLAVAGSLVGALSAPFIIDQIATIGQRGTGVPILLHPFDVLSEAIPYALRRILDLPAYWTLLLPIEFPAVYIAGVLSLIFLLRASVPSDQRNMMIAVAILAGTGLSISWLLVGDLGGNNDLGMRAVLPSIAILTAAATAGIVMRPLRMTVIVPAFGGLLLSLPHTLDMIRYNFEGNVGEAGRTFAQTPELWAAVRRHSEPGMRIGNNPLYLKDMTPWPVNISWALLADRSSCFAGNDLVLAYVPIPQAKREAIQEQFVRVFDGKATPDDISDLAKRYGCKVVVVTAQDRAWQSDPFAASSLYRQVDSKEGQWRIYKATFDSRDR